MSTPPLLQLIEGRRVRPRKAPAIRQSEFQLQADIVALLRKYRRPDWRFWHTPNGEIRDPRTAAKLKAMGVLPGVPDLLLLAPDGSLRCLECKAHGGRLSDEQEDFRTFCIAREIPYVTAFKIDDALAAFREWGCLTINISEGSI
jgi:hypothetical protein